MTAPSGGSLGAFVLIVVAVWVMVIAAIRHGSPALTGRAILALAVYAAATAGASASGVMARPALPPPVLFFFSGSMLVAVALGLSPLGRRLATTTPMAALVAFHGFRLPLELVLHAWVARASSADVQACRRSFHRRSEAVGACGPPGSRNSPTSAAVRWARSLLVAPRYQLTRMRPSEMILNARNVLSRSGQRGSIASVSLLPFVELHQVQASRKLSQLRRSAGASDLGIMCSTSGLGIRRPQKLHQSPRRSIRSSRASR